MTIDIHCRRLDEMTQSLRIRYSLRTLLLCAAGSAIVAFSFRFGFHVGLIIIGISPACVCFFLTAGKLWRWRRLAHRCAAIGLAVLFLYVASVGPVGALCERTVRCNLVEPLYAPLIVVFGTSPSSPLDWYVDEWERTLWNEG